MRSALDEFEADGDARPREREVSKIEVGGDGLAGSIEDEVASRTDADRPRAASGSRISGTGRSSRLGGRGVLSRSSSRVASPAKPLGVGDRGLEGGRELDREDASSISTTAGRSAIELLSSAVTSFFKRIAGRLLNPSTMIL